MSLSPAAPFERALLITLIRKGAFKVAATRKIAVRVFQRFHSTSLAVGLFKTHPQKWGCSYSSTILRGLKSFTIKGLAAQFAHPQPIPRAKCYEAIIPTPSRRIAITGVTEWRGFR